MTDMVKKYVPYAVIILLVYMLLPLVFIPGAMQKFSPVAYDFVFPITAIGCSAHYCSKHGLDFLFALIAPIIYLPSMLIYNGGFSSSTLSTNLILLVVYLVAGIFGLFLGDLAFGDKRRQKEKAEQEEAEEMLLEAKRREKEELENIAGLVPNADVVYGPLYRNPKRIFGIGLNYVDHAGDIGSAAPKGFPGSFFKMADTLIGPGDEILLPKLKEAQKTTAEAELGIIMGKDCRDVSEENWQDAIVGYTTILDMTEESILKGNDYVTGNPRYLCIVKNFPTFFSFGPQLVTPDEVPDVLKLNVQSIHNGEVHAENVVANMTHRPARLVSLHSSIQGWYAGDILSTGTPRAFHIQDGDIAECRIQGPDGFEMAPLVNPVVDLKKHPEK